MIIGLFVEFMKRVIPLSETPQAYSHLTGDYHSSRCGLIYQRVQDEIIDFRPIEKAKHGATIDNHLGLRTKHRERINEEDLNDLIDQFRRVQLVCPKPWKRHVSSQHLQRRVSHRSFGDRAESSSPSANGVNGTAAGLRTEDAKADLSSNPVLEASEVGTPRRGLMVDSSTTTSLLERLDERASQTGVQHLNKSEPSDHRDLDNDRRSKMRREIGQSLQFRRAHVLDTRDLTNSVDRGESTSNSLPPGSQMCGHCSDWIKSPRFQRRTARFKPRRTPSWSLSGR